MTPDSLASARTRGPTVFLATQIGIGIRYFCQTGILRELSAKGINLVVIVPNPGEVKQLLADEYPSVTVEKLELEAFDKAFAAGSFAWLRSIVYVCVTHLRMIGMSKKMNLAVARDVRMLDERKWRLAGSKMRYMIPVLRGLSSLLQSSRMARRVFEWLQDRRPIDFYHSSLFERHRPTLVVASSPGWWPSEEIILKEAKARGIATLGVVPGWDHPCSRGLPGARPSRVAVWSEIHKAELVQGSDFDPRTVDISGPVHFDLYRDPDAVIPREAYMRERGLDPERRLITFGCSFVGLSPNLSIVESLADAVRTDAFGTPVQLLVRLHPSHLKPAIGKYREVRDEATRLHELAARNPNVQIDVPLLGSQGVANYTSPEDARALASLFAHSSVFVTLFSTMVLESCFNDVPVVAAAFDPPASNLHDFLPITEALDWPTHDRIIRARAATVANNPIELVQAVRRYLEQPLLHSEERRSFARQECTFVDGRCSSRLADLIDTFARSAVVPVQRKSEREEAKRFGSVELPASQL